MTLSRREFLIKSFAATAGAGLPLSQLEPAFGGAPSDWDQAYCRNILYAATREHPQPIELRVIEGSLPQGLKGSFFRNGPNPHFMPTSKYHWFDGDGMVHKVRFDGQGQAFVQNRFVNTQKLQRERGFFKSFRKGLAEGFGIKGAIDILRGNLAPLNTSNTDLVYHNGELLSLWYMGDRPYSLSASTLETRHQRSQKMVAHPKVCPQTGELVFFDLDLNPISIGRGEKPRYWHGVMDANGQLVRNTPIDLPGGRLVHDIGITASEDPNECYSVFFDNPTGFPFGNPDKEPSRIAVIPRYAQSQSEVIWFQIDPCYILHIPNVFVENQKLTVFGTRIADLRNFRDGMPSIDTFTYESYLWKWVIDLGSRQIIESRRVSESMIEFPSINRNFTGAKNRYIYAPKLAQDSMVKFDGLWKYDINTNSSRLGAYGEGIFGEEAQFAQRWGASEEDDGWLVTFVHNTSDSKVSSHGSEFWVMNAREFQYGQIKPVARLHIPYRVPIGFHSVWVDSI